MVEHFGDAAWAMEYFRLVKGEAGPLDETTGRENDLFAGLDLATR
jgi:hypothetical protein